MKKILILMLSLMTIFFAGCGEEKISAEDKNVAPEKISAENKNADAEKISELSANGKKILVAYFSRADENYNVGNISEGNTKIVAEMIAEKIGADVFEIKPAKSYPQNYQECTEVAKIEREENARPEIVGRVENFSDYDVIFLGYPIWWGDLPMAVYTFLEQENFSGKIIAPFCTHEGSGLGGTEKFISEKTNAKLLPGLAIKGSVAQNDREKTKFEVENWLQILKF